MAIHLDRRLPDGSCGRPEGCAAHVLPASRVVALLFGLAPGRACRVSLRRPKPPASSLWRWSSPRGGWELPTTLRWGARTFLTPLGLPRSARGHPAVSLTNGFYLPPDRSQIRAGHGRTPDASSVLATPPDDRRRTARHHPVDGLVAHRVGEGVLRAGHVRRGPATG